MAPERAERPRRTQAERTAATRALLLAATVDSLVECGFRRTTTLEVARRAGVSHGALLHHFPTRSALLCGAVGHLLDQRVTEFRKAMADLPPGASERDGAIDLLWSMFQGPTFTAWLELTVAARTDPELADAVRRVDATFADTCIDVFRELFPTESAADPNLPRVAVAMLFTFLDGLALAQTAPVTQLLPADELLEVFKLLVSSAPSPPGGTP